MIQEEEFWKKIEEAEEFTEEEVRGAIERLEESWRWEGKVILWKERIYVLDSATLWEEIIIWYHDSKLAEHLGYTYHKWSLTICDGCFDTLKSSKMQS